MMNELESEYWSQDDYHDELYANEVKIMKENGMNEMLYAEDDY